MSALPHLLWTPDVAGRYGCHPRAARKIMREAGGFPAAGRMVVRADDLDRYEQSQAEAARIAANTPQRPPGGRKRLDRRRTHSAITEPQNTGDRYRTGWWREGIDVG